MRDLSKASVTPTRNLSPRLKSRSFKSIIDFSQPISQLKLWSCKFLSLPLLVQSRVEAISVTLGFVRYALVYGS